MLKPDFKTERQIGVGHVSIPDTARQYIADILDSGRLTYGKYTAGFERAFAELHDLRHAIMCNSGTSALQVALHTLKKHQGWSDGDEVIVPAVGFVADVNVVLQNRLKPVFADVHPVHFDLDPNDIEKRISDKTRAVIIVDIGGQVADMDPLLEVAEKHNLAVLEDACETMAVKYRGRMVGTFGRISCFSTYSAHILPTGVGGLVCTNDGDLARTTRSLVNHGRDDIYTSIDDDDTDDPDKLRQIIARRFSFTDIGYSYRAAEFEAALGLSQVPQLTELVKARGQNANTLTSGLQDLEGYLQLPQVRPGSEHSFMFYPVIVREDGLRDRLVYFLEKNRIETRFLLPLLSQPIYRQIFGDIEKDYPVAKHVTDNGFYIGCHQGLSLEDLNHIIDFFHRFFK